MINALKTAVGSIKTNYSGVRVKEKLVIIESDDWGAIRMPDAATLNQLKQQGIDLTNSQYAKDGLETNEDLEILFGMLSKYKDRHGNHPIITANTIVANPDFEKIQSDNYQTYQYIKLNDWIKSLPASNQLINLYQQGNQQRIFRPQFHGREHLNYNRWLKDINQGNAKAKTCLQHGFTSCGEGDYAYMEAYDWTIQQEVELHKTIITDGLNLFEEIFGYRSNSFIPPCYTLDKSIEPELLKQGVQILQGTRNHLQPTGQFEKYQAIKRNFGMQSNGQFYNVRNVFFEPTLTTSTNPIAMAMQQIKTAFVFHKPAVICTHRVNFTGSIDTQNRNKGIHQFEQLIKQILQTWPDVRFIATDEVMQYV